ncbi:hypothetical protein CEXT_312771 [Caerostris extrusa]|uniref:Uncharacterized protein n=1 Tax=Caerostris extrusa TaxID=172846 RepID=A0AAV4RE11_CAEEX|nr:hypothetical protein CEXT_312771 [Caerostris extrusa]
MSVSSDCNSGEEYRRISSKLDLVVVGAMLTNMTTKSWINVTLDLKSPLRRYYINFSSNDCTVTIHFPRDVPLNNVDSPAILSY